MFGIKRLLGIARLEERVKKMGADMPEVARCMACGKMDFVENLIRLPENRPPENESSSYLVPDDWAAKLRDLLWWIHPECLAANRENYGRRDTDKGE